MLKNDISQIHTKRESWRPTELSEGMLREALILEARRTGEKIPNLVTEVDVLGYLTFNDGAVAACTHVRDARLALCGNDAPLVVRAEYVHALTYLVPECSQKIFENIQFYWVGSVNTKSVSVVGTVIAQTDDGKAALMVHADDVRVVVNDSKPNGSKDVRSAKRKIVKQLVAAMVPAIPNPA